MGLGRGFHNGQLIQPFANEIGLELKSAVNIPDKIANGFLPQTNALVNGGLGIKQGGKTNKFVSAQVVLKPPPQHGFLVQLKQGATLVFDFNLGIRPAGFFSNNVELTTKVIDGVIFAFRKGATIQPNHYGIFQNVKSQVIIGFDGFGGNEQVEFVLPPLFCGVLNVVNFHRFGGVEIKFAVGRRSKGGKYRKNQVPFL